MGLVIGGKLEVSRNFIGQSENLHMVVAMSKLPKKIIKQVLAEFGRKGGLANSPAQQEQRSKAKPGSGRPRKSKP